MERPLRPRPRVKSHALGSRPSGRTWDVYLRSTAALGLSAIALVLAAPEAGALVGFAIYTLW